METFRILFTSRRFVQDMRRLLDELVVLDTRDSLLPLSNVDSGNNIAHNIERHISGHSSINAIVLAKLFTCIWVYFVRK